jgi:hypothetical protein
LDSSSDRLTAKEDAYFVAYANKISKMKGWELVREVANKMADFDDLDGGSLSETTKNSSTGSRTSRQIEILMKENLRRKKY